MPSNKNFKQDQNPSFAHVKGLALEDVAKFTMSNKIEARRVYVIKANGIVERSSRNIFVKNIKLEPGDTIVVPRKTLAQRPGLEALIPVTQILSDLAFSAAALDNLTSN